jgi:hypothetical protein
LVVLVELVVAATVVTMVMTMPNPELRTPVAVAEVLRTPFPTHQVPEVRV